MNEKDIIEMTQERLKKNPFKTPDGYFEQLQGRIIQKINDQENSSKDNKTAKTVKLHKKETRYIAIAASMMALFTLGSVYNAFMKHETGRTNNPMATATQQASMTSDALELAADYTMCDNDDIVAFLMDD